MGNDETLTPTHLINIDKKLFIVSILFSGLWMITFVAISPQFWFYSFILISTIVAFAAMFIHKSFVNNKIKLSFIWSLAIIILWPIFVPIYFAVRNKLQVNAHIYPKPQYVASFILLITVFLCFLMSTVILTIIVKDDNNFFPNKSNNTENYESYRDNRDFIHKYADNIRGNIASSGHCNRYHSMIDAIANSGGSDQVKVIQIDKIFDSAARTRCIRY